MADPDRRQQLGRAGCDRFAARFSTAAQVASVQWSLGRVTGRERVAA
jgi:hypothetical protein